MMDWVTMSGANNQKNEELAIVQLASELWRENWDLLQCESPDFVVTTPNGTFGLEVTECHAGQSNKKGSVLARGAHHRQRIMDEIRVKAIKVHPQVAGWALTYLGPWTDRDGVEAVIMKTLEDEIRGVDWASQIPMMKDDKDLSWFNAMPPAFVNQSPQSLAACTWRYMEDYGGDLEISSDPLQAAIDAKAGKLPIYRERCDEVRLLVSALSLRTSGNVSVDPAYSPNLRGFDIVYFMRIPHYIVEYPSGLVATFSGHTPASLAGALRHAQVHKKPG